MKAIELYRNNDHIILVTAVKFKDLKNIVKFTQRTSSNWSDNNDESSKFYQRQTNEIRVENIKKYISSTIFENNESEILFPSSMILSINSDYNEFKKDEFNVIDFELPTAKESCLIVDGQHRMKAMFSLYKELEGQFFAEEKLIKVLNYKFNCTILVDYDIWEQAKIFANVNFNQKPVDRSLYYDIFGEIPKFGKDEKLGDLYVAHELGKFLNLSSKSPLKGFVRNFNSGKGFISQAFLTQQILRLLGPRSGWNDIVEDFKKNDDERLDLHKKLPKVFVAYFSTLKKEFSEYWPKSIDKSQATILTKTTSLGAFLRLLGRINELFKLGLFPNYDKMDLKDLSLEKLEEIFNNIFKPFDHTTTSGKELSAKYFGQESKYKGGGSMGLQSQLFKELAKEIGIPA
ncbi:MAG: DGQHR domain-containing protein [Chryseobacterium sp.]|uniref:DGQHR domain-containing protein n=1 Tax=Chryseobacterium sp. TaxID=1871047 RepID=UPI002837A128|nr:DGQHR domain-containing protein [Chryseobacterium sp.]MDR2235316.1 DGQHR domain-containing protein [Chryseobacterium sp.]